MGEDKSKQKYNFSVIILLYSPSRFLVFIRVLIKQSSLTGRERCEMSRFTGGHRCNENSSTSMLRLLTRVLISASYGNGFMVWIDFYHDWV